MKLIVIVGKKRSGKDTLAEYVVTQKNGYKHQLAAPIKATLARAYSSLFNESKAYPSLKWEDWEGIGEWDRERPFVMNNYEAQDLLHKSLDVLSRQYRLNRYMSDGGNKVNNIIENITINNSEPWTIRRFMQTLGTDIVVDGIDRMFWMKLFADAYFDKFYSDHDYFVVPDVRQVHEIEALRAMGATIIHVVRPDTVDSTDQHITEAGLPIGDDDVVIVNDGTLEELYTKFEHEALYVPNH